MKNKYKGAMEHIEVTSEMHDRIMRNIGTADIAEKRGTGKVSQMNRRYYAVAACLAVLLGCIFAIHGIIDSTKPPIQIVPDIVEYSSVNELSAAVGFTVLEVGGCPFETGQVQYIAYWGKLAQIVYTGDNNALVFRMSAGSEDISGDYSEYSDVKSLSMGEAAVTLKGDRGQYALAIWEKGGYSYSINMTAAVSEEEMMKAVESVG